jgi:hypothetical protein
VLASKTAFIFTATAKLLPLLLVLTNSSPPIPSSCSGEVAGTVGDEDEEKQRLREEKSRENL